MHSIKLLLHINANIEEVYNQLTTIEGLKKWWTVQTSGSPCLNGLIDFSFGERYFIQMKVVKLKENKTVQWKCIEADKDWIGTVVSFELEKTADKTQLRFTHDKWPTHEDFFAHCSLSWAKYLLSLRSLLEMGKGQPFKP